MFLIRRNGQFNIVPSLCGILSAFVTAMVIEIVMSQFSVSYQMDIISDSWEAISAFVQDELGRGATIIRVEGGYKQDKRVILRVVFDRFQYSRIKRFIAKIDPKAFVTITKTNAVYGEGFKAHSTGTKPIHKKK